MCFSVCVVGEHVCLLDVCVVCVLGVCVWWVCVLDECGVWVTVVGG